MLFGGFGTLDRARLRWLHLFMPHEEDHEQRNADRHTRIRHIEDGKHIAVNAEIDKIDHPAVEERLFVEQDPVKHAVYEVPDRPSQNEGERNALANAQAIEIPLEVNENSDGGDDRKKSEDDFKSRDINSKRDPGIFDIGN